MSIAQQITETIDVIDRLTALLAEESRAAVNLRVDVFTPLQERKTDLAAQYAEHVEALREQQPGLAAIDDGLNQRLRAARERFAAALDENKKALATAQRVAASAIETIVAAAREAVAEPSPAYAPAAVAAGGHRRPPSAVSVNVKL